MPNKSLDTLRPLLQFFYHQPQYREVKNYGTESLFGTVHAAAILV